MCRTMISRSVALVTVTVAAMALAGCSGSSSAATGSTAGSTTAATGTVSIGAAPGSLPVIAEQKDLPVRTDAGGFTAEDSVTVGVSSLKLDPNGTTMTLRLVFTPSIHSTTDPTKAMSLFSTDGSYPVLLDRTHLKRYRVIGSGNYGSSALDTKATSGKSFEAWFGFAAPQDSVSSLELTVNSSWPSFLNVPVQR